jgi:glycerol-3-phosphate dehydrogenase (NAD(P)+)
MQPGAQSRKYRVAVLGGGSFGTAIANIVADNQHEIRMWVRDEDAARELNESHINTRYLADFKLNPNIYAMTGLQEVVESADVVFVAIPSRAFVEVVRQIRPWLRPEQILVSTTKGIQADGFRLMSQILRDETGMAQIGALSGPNLAKEIMARMLTGTVIASESSQVRTVIQELLSCPYFRVYANSDVFGVELGGALKNIYAIASGMASELNLGENTKSMLMTRSLAEMSRFAAHLGANPLTFLGLAGVGDLFATCTSPLSRNFQVGQALARGRKLDDTVERLGGTAEGVNTTRLVKHKADELNIYMPLAQGLYDILFEAGNLQSVIRRLMLGEQNTDVEFVLPRHCE